jgi:hypothetical protein
MTFAEIWVGIVGVVVVPLGGWALKKTSEHDKALAVYDTKLENIDRRVTELHQFFLGQHHGRRNDDNQAPTRQ